MRLGTKAAGTWPGSSTLALLNTFVKAKQTHTEKMAYFIADRKARY
jgi:hypothetical protein